MKLKTESASALNDAMRKVGIFVSDGYSIRAAFKGGAEVVASIYLRNGAPATGDYGIGVTWWQGTRCLHEQRSPFLISKNDPDATEKLHNLALHCADMGEMMAGYRLSKGTAVPYRVDGTPETKTAVAARQFPVPRADELETHRRSVGRSSVVVPFVKPKAKVKVAAKAPATGDLLRAAVEAEVASIKAEGAE